METGSARCKDNSGNRKLNVAVPANLLSYKPTRTVEVLFLLKFQILAVTAFTLTSASRLSQLWSYWEYGVYMQTEKLGYSYPCIRVKY